MLSALAGIIMAAKVHCTEIKYNFTKRQDQQISETIYKNKVDKHDETEKYEKSILPESGYMTVEEYEAKSRAKSRREISATILDKADMPEDKNYVYIPQYKFKLAKYNNPVGTPELSLPRKLNFDRQINAQGIVSGDKSILVYPAVYYYAQSDCTCCDLFMIKLDQNLPEVERIEKANIINKEEKPLLSTIKDIDTKFVFRTLTPIDFSSDNTKLIVKEKIGFRHDGIWKTNLWIYDFNKQKATELPEIRNAIVHYWQGKENIDFDEKRWDIYPMGFDANNDNRVVVCAYAYTGDVPIFLGTWSIDTEGVESRLESLKDISVPINTVGYKLVEDSDVTPISEIEFNKKQEEKAEKAKKKEEKAEKKAEETQKKVEYKRKINQMDMETMLKIKARQDYLKQYKANHKSTDGTTGN